MALEIVESKTTKKVMPTKQRIILAVLCLILGITIFAVAYFSMKNGLGIGNLNQNILTWMVEHRNQYVIDIAKTLTYAASPMVLISACTVICLVWAVVKRELWRPAALAGSMATAALTSIILKNTIMDARPPQTDMIPAFQTDFSFPSGHTIGICVFLLVISYLIYSRNYSSRQMWIWLFVSAVITTTIAITRLYLGYHWLTDVVASFGLGLIVFSTIIFIDTIVTKRQVS